MKYKRNIKGLVKKDKDQKELELETCIKENYVFAFRTACFILGNTADAEEAVQEAFLRAWRFRATLTKESNLQPWLYRIVVNACFSNLRRTASRREASQREIYQRLEGFTTSVGSPELEMNLSETHQVVIDALKNLPVHLKVPVILRYYADLSEQDIAIVIQRRQGTVKSRLHEARRRLSEQPALKSLAAELYVSARYNKEQI
jgi:RNA polymerase sigma-70 factor (ECF subfamily)